MKIGIDGIALTIRFPCGTRHYAEQLLRHLAVVDHRNTYIIFSPEYIALPQASNFFLHIIQSKFPLFRRQLWLPFAVRREHIDVFHYLHPYGAIFFRHPKIVTTVHDVELDAIFSGVHNAKYIFQHYYCAMTRQGVFRNTKRFITVSNTVKKELSHFLESLALQTKIDVISSGVDKRFGKTIKYRVSAQYLLTMADYSPRKNIFRTLRAYARLPSRIKNIYRLKIITSTSYPAKHIADTVKELNVIERVDIVEGATIQQLIELYNHATCFLYPSLYEGFGLPILEAMACGCPVITSNRGATAEVAGDAAYLVNPESTSAIARAITRIVLNHATASSLREKGRQRYALFSWHHTAQETLRVYEEVYRS